jgi:death-on-curing family protein
VTLQLSASIVRYTHDILVNLWLPFDQIVYKDNFDDIGLLESALARPFQTFGGEELYPTLPLKAAALFHSLVCNHCFANGNKRTAVIALHFFMLGNGRMLVTSNEELYSLANDTADANRNGIRPEQVVENLHRFIEEESVPTDKFNEPEVIAALGNARIQKITERIEWTKKMLEEVSKDPHLSD